MELKFNDLIKMNETVPELTREETVVDANRENDEKRDHILEMALRMVDKYEQKETREKKTRKKESTDIDTNSLSDISNELDNTIVNIGNNGNVQEIVRDLHPHRYKCCCFEVDGPVINYAGKLTVSLCVLFFCFVQIHRSSDDFAAYMTLISGVLGIFISTPKMKKSRQTE